MDGVRMAVLSSRMNVIVEGMMNTIFRSSRSGVLNAAHDFSCCIVSADHQLVIGAESLPIHMMSGPDLISRAIVEAYPEPKRGDAYLHNSPYNGNSHAADHCMVVPVVDEQGVHRFTILAKAHQADCGNSQPTTYMSNARDVYEEGALIFDACRVQNDYKDADDILRMLKLRIRVPDQWWGDYLALLGSVRLGERRMLELGEEIGWDVLDEFVVEWLNYSENMMSEAIAKLPAGSFSASTTHDPYPGAPDGVPIKVDVVVDPLAKRIDLDLRENVDCLPNGLNLTESTARTAAMIGVFNSIGEGVPPNAGSLRRLDVALRDNCAVGIPRHPHSCSAATTNLADRVSNMVQAAFAEYAEGVGMAECGAVIPAAAAVVSGRDPRSDHDFVNQIFLAVTGGAGTPWTDAWLTIFHVGCGGMLRRDSIEGAEMAHPILVRSQKLVQDTEGAGRYRGAPSAYVEYGPVGTTLSVAYGTDGAINPAKGVRGGAAGGPSQHYRRLRDGSLEELSQQGLIELGDGETIVSITAGGGGYGDPADRPADVVQRDVHERWISADRAMSVYGVALDEAGAVDEKRTRELRSEPLVDA
ncbi:hydantoinase B/oxoprolinase family protein [Nocardioides cavernae]|uniref:Hydantoinase B/oxoprolinase family protein n=1 Tax=Nocardioides cavernae TaxID=1921566 RepID=A0ABR8NAM0_9ACTN|nr:hydantoinase B/oxoprolinase family protein [Nocardioides cavernae]MBD3924225.1 hydantoinase B/oxoprolinase family protein [Nocardioides cavernae]MBM7510836.1 N-methylhydantoinase B [Nocardioides cavernae]